MIDIRIGRQYFGFLTGSSCNTANPISQSNEGPNERRQALLAWWEINHGNEPSAMCTPTRHAQLIENVITCESCETRILPWSFRIELGRSFYQSRSQTFVPLAPQTSGNG
jgi:hypothetical protein